MGRFAGTGPSSSKITWQTGAMWNKNEISRCHNLLTTRDKFLNEN